MKKLFLAILVISSATAAEANYIQCGIPPIPPIGCSSQGAQCVCTAQGQCHWVFVCN